MLGLWILLTVPLCGRAAVEAPLPPARPWSGASEALVVSPAEKTGLTETPNYEETIAYLRRLEAASPLVSVREFGRPTLLVQGGIHSGEIDGKDAGLMLLRDVVLRGEASLLDRANLLFVPVFNADGHERASRWNRPNQRGPVRQGWRTTAQNLNLNRDYMKADAPEMQAMLRLIQEWSPSLSIVLHVTDGIGHQYDITFGYNGDAGGFAWSPRIAGWLEGTSRPAVEGALKAAGHVPGRFYDGESMVSGLVSGTEMSRYSHGYGDLRHLPTIPVECHSLKPYRQRVLGTYVLMEAALRTLGAWASDVAAAIAADRNAWRDAPSRSHLTI